MQEIHNATSFALLLHLFSLRELIPKYAIATRSSIVVGIVGLLCLGLQVDALCTGICIICYVHLQEILYPSLFLLPGAAQNRSLNRSIFACLPCPGINYIYGL